MRRRSNAESVPVQDSMVRGTRRDDNAPAFARDSAVWTHRADHSAPRSIASIRGYASNDNFALIIFTNPDGASVTAGSSERNGWS